MWKVAVTHSLRHGEFDSLTQDNALEVHIDVHRIETPEVASASLAVGTVSYPNGRGKRFKPVQVRVRIPVTLRVCIPTVEEAVLETVQ